MTTNLSRASVATIAGMSLILAGCAAGASPSGASIAPSSVPTASATPAASVDSHASVTGTIFFSRNTHDPTDGYFATLGADGVLHAQTLPGARCCMSLSPDGTWILMQGVAVAGIETTGFVHPDGSGYVDIPVGGGTLNLGPGAWAPDNATVAFEGWDDTHPNLNGVYIGRRPGVVVSPAANAPKQISSAPKGQHDVPISFSPDGSRILYVRTTTQYTGLLYTALIDGSGQHLLTPEGDSVWTDSWTGLPATWSPDGTQVAFAAFATPDGTGGQSAIFVADVASGVAKRITDLAPWTMTVDWSPDGQRIIFNKGASGDQEVIYTVHPDGSQLTKVVESMLGACCAIWSPDGTEILYAQGGDTRNLYVARGDGSGGKPITATATEYNWYSWRP